MEGTTSEVGLPQLILADNIILFPQGCLNKDSINIAIKIAMPFGSIETIEDEYEHLRSLQQANALFTYAKRTTYGTLRSK
jgi:hypothetical protein